MTVRRPVAFPAVAVRVGGLCWWMNLALESRQALHDSIEVLREFAEAEREFARIMRLRGNLEAARFAEYSANRADVFCSRVERKVW